MAHTAFGPKGRHAAGIIADLDQASSAI